MILRNTKKKSNKYRTVPWDTGRVATLVHTRPARARSLRVYSCNVSHVPRVRCRRRVPSSSLFNPTTTLLFIYNAEIQFSRRGIVSKLITLTRTRITRYAPYIYIYKKTVKIIISLVISKVGEPVPRRSSRSKPRGVRRRIPLRQDLL